MEILDVLFNKFILSHFYSCRELDEFGYIEDTNTTIYGNTSYIVECLLLETKNTKNLVNVLQEPLILIYKFITIINKNIIRILIIYNST